MKKNIARMLCQILTLLLTSAPAMAGLDNIVESRSVPLPPASIAPAAPAKNNANHVEPLINQLQKIKQSISHSTQQDVMIGSEQSELNNIDTLLSTYSTMLANAQKYNEIKKQSQLNLTWKEGESVKNKADLYNAGNANEPLTICRAPFLGASFQSTGTYPGQLTDKGCLISFAGYAFFVSHYQVLSSKEASKDQSNLEWVPIEQLKMDYHIKDPLLSQGQLSSKSRNFEYPRDSMGVYTPLYQSESFRLNQSLPIPLAGGFEGNRPVYICRVLFQQHLKIGKWVNFIGQSGQGEAACDIGFDDKEIVISQDYSMLTLAQKSS